MGAVALPVWHFLVLSTPVQIISNNFHVSLWEWALPMQIPRDFKVYIANLIKYYSHQL